MKTAKEKDRTWKKQSCVQGMKEKQSASSAGFAIYFTAWLGSDLEAHQTWGCDGGKVFQWEFDMQIPRMSISSGNALYSMG